MNFIGNLQAGDNVGNTSTDVSLKPDVSGLTSLSVAQPSTTIAAFTSTANSAFTTGAGSGFYYGGVTGSLVGANTISSTGAFTGTLLALTADSTTAGTILGISGQGLVNGKAIDVSLGTAYNLAGNDPNKAGQAAGAVNVRAGAYNGNIFNVLSTANIGSDTANLANLESGQTLGQLLKIKTNGAYTGSATTGILNIDANSATGGTVARISATSLTGATNQALSVTLGASSSATAILANTGLTYSGKLIDLQINGGSQFKVDATNTTLAGGLLGSNGVAFVIDETGPLLPINIGGTTASQVNIARLATLTNVLGTLTSARTLTVTGTSPATAFVVDNVGGVTAQGIGTFGPFTGNQLLVQGAAYLSAVQLRATSTGATPDANVSISLAPKGTGRVTVAGASGGLDVVNDIVAGSGLANHVQLVGSATTVPVSVNATGLDGNITLQLTPKGTGTVQINGTGGISGPAAAALVIDATGLQNINIGGTAAATLNLGRSLQTQALLGNATVAGTLGVTGNVTVSASLFGSNAAGFLIDSSVNQPLKLGTAGTTTSLTISRAGQTTTVAGALTVTQASTFNGTLQVGATGTALNEVRFGTCTIVSTSVPAGGAGSANTVCTIASNPNLQAYQIAVTPAAVLPAGLAYSVDFPSTTALSLRWVNSTGGAVFTTALTFKWTAVR